MRYAVILAGGAGKRLWPLSRLSRPKQLLSLVNGKNLLALAVERLEGLFEKKNIWIATSHEYADAVAQALPHIPRENILGEPEPRDTANAIALTAEILAARDDQATMVVLTADHVIRPVDRFQRDVRTACEAAEQHPDSLLTFGIRPTWPHTGLGYIHRGKTLSDGVHEVLSFKEKPDHYLARRYVESGEYYWNSGMFVWKVGAIRKALKEFLPSSVAKLAPIAQAARSGKNYSQLLAEVYPTLEKISIDYAVMEKTRNVLVVELNCEWLDVGSWPSLENVTDLDEAGNAIVATNCVVLDSFRNVLVAEDEHLLAILGMDDCIVVRSADATLVCNKSDSQRLKELVDLIEAKFGKRYL